MSGTAAGESAIDVRGLHKRFGKKHVVKDLTLRVGRGEIFGFLGPNGSGKTTTIRMMCGLLTPDSGSGTCLGFDLLKQREQIKRRVGYMTQRFSFWEDLSIRENLDFVARVYEMPQRRQVVEQALDTSSHICPEVTGRRRLGEPRAHAAFDVELRPRRARQRPVVERERAEPAVGVESVRRATDRVQPSEGAADVAPLLLTARHRVHRIEEEHRATGNLDDTVTHGRRGADPTAIVEHPQPKHLGPELLSGLDGATVLGEHANSRSARFDAADEHRARVRRQMREVHHRGALPRGPEVPRDRDLELRKRARVGEHVPARAVVRTVVRHRPTPCQLGLVRASRECSAARETGPGRQTARPAARRRVTTGIATEPATTCEMASTTLVAVVVCPAVAGPSSETATTAHAAQA